MSDTLLEEQGILKKQLQSSVSNFKKTPKERYSWVYIQTKLDLLEKNFAKFYENHIEILRYGDMKDEYMDSYFEVEDLYASTKELMKSKQKEYKSYKDASETSQLQSQSIVTSDTPRTRLPPINLPVFSGNYNEWPSFRDLFISLIDNENTLSDIQKHHYLRSSLKGEAEQLLRHFDVTAANYNKAWNTLINRYSNKRIIVNSILNKFLNQKKINFECSKSLKELLDTTNECISSLNNLEIQTVTWDPFIVHIVVTKLDPETRKVWEHSIGSSNNLPTYNEFTSFLEGRFRALEMIQINYKNEKRESLSSHNTHKPKIVKTFTVETNTKCTYCTNNHYICHCTEFTQLNVEQRREFAKKNGLCFNCLVKGHSIKNCRQRTSCKTCNHKHHTLLHDAAFISKQIHTASVELESPQITSMNASISDRQVLLATAQVRIVDKYGSLITLRALVDQGSQATFITESAVQLLGLKKISLEAQVTGIGNTTHKSKHIVKFNIHSTLDSIPITQVSAHVMKKLTSLLPSKAIDISQIPGLSTLKLSDPHLNEPGPIDLLLGAEVYALIVIEGLRKFGSLIAQNSRLGWLVSGTTKTKTDSSSQCSIRVHTTLVEVDQLLRKFWELEEVSTKETPTTLLDKYCEAHFKETHSRNEEGRYIVRLPFKEGYEERLGDSFDIAKQRLLHMEKKFAKQPKFKKDYKDFMDQYQSLHHMEDVKSNEKPDHKVYYLPHHAVIRESSTTTKLRTVFDGSAKLAEGSSLNDELLIGPPLQQDLRNLILRWRTHKIALIADVKQMYRQILVSTKDIDYQRILWRSSPLEAIQEKRLLTVTYGTSCAPFLAIRTLKQLAQDEQAEFPDLVEIIDKHFYIDDLLSGANSQEQALELKNRITKFMSKGKFEMHKWASNSPDVLSDISDSHKAKTTRIDITMDDTIKALGIKWDSNHDVFEIAIKLNEHNLPFTKTTVLSDIARAFDPLGFLSPIIVTAKMFLQKLWVTGISWTDELPSDLAAEWLNYRKQILDMNTIHVDRWIKTQFNGYDRIEVHGFSDASTLAYAAAVYVRVITEYKTHVSLLIAKSKVAPVKQVSLPRLELCGAVLLAKLIEGVKKSLNINNDSIYMWTDSTIVLSWLRKLPSTWKTFVANRTTEILNVTSSDQWHHIKSIDNPADLATRGVNPNDLKDCNMWWHGPQFLHNSKEIPLTSSDIPATDLESKVIHINVCTHIKQDDEVLAFLNRYSNLSKLVRVTAYIFRFIRKCKDRYECKRTQKESISFPQYLTVRELKNAMNVCIRISQKAHFYDDIHILRKGNKFSEKSKLKSLTPFIDQNDILRVSGRLRNAKINYNTQCPIVLSDKCHLATLIARDAHIHALHGGPQLTLNIVRQKFWIIGARNLIKKIVRKCISCFKHSSAPINQLMGQLPTCRVNPVKPFRISGLDYAGPVNLKLYPGRCKKTMKAYICLFICTVSKAIHLELVSDLSSAAFIAAFRRFTARRGHCSDLWSDCATNFIGASKELDVMFKNRKSDVIGQISELLANEHTTWHFIPPGSPHFGGLWEAGVKSIKKHIKRVIGQAMLTFEEYATLLSQVEACVNSRPLSPISTSIDDELPITPGHFLLGEVPITVPEGSLDNINISRLDRWQMIQKLLQNFWSRWSTEYLVTLQNRYKWSKTNSEPDVGSIVLVKDERLPPGKWLLGRIMEKHPGQDGLTRVVTVKFKNNEFKRPITKICPLPID